MKRLLIANFHRVTFVSKRVSHLSNMKVLAIFVIYLSCCNAIKRSEESSEMVSGYDRCGVNEESNRCPPCHQTCEDLNRICRTALLCSVDDLKRCFCKPGLVRIFPEGPCIPSDMCQEVSSKCGPHEEIPTMVPCIQGCPDPLALVKCFPTPNTAKDCFCKQGFVRIFPGGPCFPNKICAFMNNRKCLPNEEIPQCEPCITTCREHLAGKICTKECRFTRQCFCKPGFLWNRKGVCVPRSRCLLDLFPSAEIAEMMMMKG